MEQTHMLFVNLEEFKYYIDTLEYLELTDEERPSPIRDLIAYSRILISEAEILL